MRRIALLPLLFALVISLAAPAGAAFALDEEIEQVVLSSDISEDVAKIGVIEELPSTGPAPSAFEEEGSESIQLESVLESKPGPVLDVQAEDTSTPPPSPPTVTPPPVMLPVSPLLITAYKASGAHMHVVQLYNNSSSMVPLDGVSLLYMTGDETQESQYEIPLVSGWIEPRSYVVAVWQNESEYADIEFQFDSIGGGALELIELRHAGYQPVEVVMPTGYAGELLHRFKSAAGNYTTNTTFSLGAPSVHGGGLYVLPDSPSLSVLEILVNPRSCTFGAETPDCYDYIKVRNDSAEPLDLSLYRLRSGFSNTNSTASNTTYFDDVLAPGEVRTLTHSSGGERLSFAANDGTVWLEDRYGYEAYNLKVSPYVDSDLTANTGRSWAYNDATGQWQWATPSPHEVENNFTVIEAGKGSASTPRQLVPCRDDQYRSEETNRCRTIAAPSTLQPCREGQYRSEETNRCRSIATAAASVLKPCADDQFRNPLTNRCKKIASADDVALADCGEGRERNPVTNRCRNVLGAGTLADTLPFPVEKTPQDAESFAAWWALGIVAVAGAGYGVWEWRYELSEVGQRARRFIARSK